MVTIVSESSFTSYGLDGVSPYHELGGKNGALTS